MGTHPDPYEFSDLLAMSRSELRKELAETVASLCTCLVNLAFVKATGDPAEKYEYEGLRDALIEQKWLIYNLIQYGD